MDFRSEANQYLEILFDEIQMRINMPSASSKIKLDFKYSQISQVDFTKDECIQWMKSRLRLRLADRFQFELNCTFRKSVGAFELLCSCNRPSIKHNRQEGCRFKIVLGLADSYIKIDNSASLSQLGHNHALRPTFVIERSSSYTALKIDDSPGLVEALMRIRNDFPAHQYPIAHILDHLNRCLREYGHPACSQQSLRHFINKNRPVPCVRGDGGDIVAGLGKLMPGLFKYRTSFVNGIERFDTVVFINPDVLDLEYRITQLTHDGTFNTVDGDYRMYGVSFRDGDNEIAWLAFAFHLDASADSYRIIVEDIRRLLGNKLSPDVVVADRDLAQRKGATVSYGGIERFCKFHLMENCTKRFGTRVSRSNAVTNSVTLSAAESISSANTILDASFFSKLQTLFILSSDFESFKSAEAAFLAKCNEKERSYYLDYMSAAQYGLYIHGFLGNGNMTTNDQESMWARVKKKCDEKGRPPTIEELAGMVVEGFRDDKRRRTGETQANVDFLFRKHSNMLTRQFTNEFLESLEESLTLGIYYRFLRQVCDGLSFEVQHLSRSVFIQEVDSFSSRNEMVAEKIFSRENVELPDLKTVIPPCYLRFLQKWLHDADLPEPKDYFVLRLKNEATFFVVFENDALYCSCGKLLSDDFPCCHAVFLYKVNLVKPSIEMHFSDRYWSAKFRNKVKGIVDLGNLVTSIGSDSDDLVGGIESEGGTTTASSSFTGGDRIYANPTASSSSSSSSSSASIAVGVPTDPFLASPDVTNRFVVEEIFKMNKSKKFFNIEKIPSPLPLGAPHDPSTLTRAKYVEEQCKILAAKLNERISGAGYTESNMLLLEHMNELYENRDGAAKIIRRDTVVLHSRKGHQRRKRHKSLLDVTRKKRKRE